MLSLRAKCLVVSAVLISSLLPLLTGMPFSLPWLDFSRKYNDGVVGGYGDGTSISADLENQRTSMRFYEPDEGKNSCDSKNYLHLIGLPRHVLPNFYFPADSLIATAEELERKIPSRYNTLYIQLDDQHRVQSVFCS